MSEDPPREWRFYVGDMLACAEKVISYTHGFDQARFVASGLNYDATIRNLELIGRSPESWLAMQDNHDLWMARQHVDLKSVAKLKLAAA
jgi:uncharacterized protein with HEPN domain